MALAAAVMAQVDIHKNTGYQSMPQSNESLVKEIYTSMYELENFFEKEKQYVEDIQVHLLHIYYAFTRNLGKLLKRSVCSRK